MYHKYYRHYNMMRIQDCSCCWWWTMALLVPVIIFANAFSGSSQGPVTYWNPGKMADILHIQVYMSRLLFCIMSKIMLTKLLPYLPGVNELRGRVPVFILQSTLNANQTTFDQSKQYQGHSDGGHYCPQYLINAHLSEERLDFLYYLIFVIQISTINKISNKVYPS